MTTTDTAALLESIRRARSVPAEWARLREGESTREQIERHQRRMDEQTDALIAAEVRAAKAEAWDEAHEIGWNNADEYWRCDGLIPSYSKADTYPNPYRVSETA